MSVTWRAEAAPAFPPSTAGCVCKRSLLWFVIISASLLISVGIISCLTVTFTDRQRAWVCVSADIIPSTASNHKRHASYLLRRPYQAVLGILPRSSHALSPDISNPGSCINACSIPALFIVSAFQTPVAFSSLLHFVALGPFPLYVLLIRNGTLLFCLLQLIQIVSYKRRPSESSDVTKTVFQ